MDENPFKLPDAKPFQFRLLTLLAAIALVGWGIVVIPHWITIYPQQRFEQKQRDIFINLANSEDARRESELQNAIDSKEAHFGRPLRPRNEEVDVMPFVMVSASILAMLAALGAVVWLNGRPRSVPKE